MMTATSTTDSSGRSAALTALERHAAFFDPNRTGVVRIGQTYAGLRRLGVSLVWRLVLPPIIHGFLGYLTQKRVSFVIAIDRIADGKHPFDSGVFDDRGELDPTAFDELFAGAGGEAITADEMRAVISRRGNRRKEMGRLAGLLGHWFSGKEVRLFFCVAADSTKTVGGRTVEAVTKGTLRTFYDGTLLRDIARRRALVAAGCVVARQNGVLLGSRESR
jgi:hypothetical protein